MDDELQQSLAAELAANLTRAIEDMTSERPSLSLGKEIPVESASNTAWRQGFTATGGSAWLVAAESTWISIGSRALSAAGIEGADAHASKSTFAEILGQAFSMLARSMSGRTKTEWNCSEGSELAQWAAGTAAWTSIDVTFPEAASETLFVAFDKALLNDFGAVAPSPAALMPKAVAAAPLRDKSKTLELLLDVELPVSVSFGRAQLALKDVIKLTTGCIVELNRTISEPVEVIVNNCVIARGEVVIVDGNFGVRIQHVVSKEERLRTLY